MVLGDDVLRAWLVLAVAHVWTESIGLGENEIDMQIDGGGLR